jgi:ribose transport system permease protein
MEISERTNGKTKGVLLRHLSQSNEIMMLIVLVLVVVFFTIMNRNYLSYANMTNILLAASTVGLVAIGETYLIIAGHIDLAIAKTAAFFSVWAALMINAGIPWPLVMIIVLISGSVVGLLNACLVNIFGLQPFIATLAVSSVGGGLAYIICNGKSVPVNEQTFIQLATIKVAGIPFPAVLMVILFIIFGFILARTVFGRSVYMIGGNPVAARLAGLSPKKISTILYVISSVIGAFAGVMMTAKMHSGQPAGGGGAEFDAITAAILGGVAFSGGKGNLRGCFVGLLIMQCFNNGLTVINVSAFWQIVAKGLLLIVALIFDFFRRKRMEK